MMARTSYQRLSHESAVLLERETSRNYHHAGATLVFEPGPLARADGGIDFEAIREAIASRLERAPLYRCKLRWIPFENHPVWVDDHEFNLDYHLRHTSLARPGTTEQLRKLAARIQAQRLDRSRPLWECWVVEGLEGGRFALVLKTHHPLAEAEAVRSARGGSLDDVLLASLAGAAARYLGAHFVNPATLDFRVAVPVEARFGNGRTGVAERVLELPVWERDPLRRLELVRERTAASGFGASGSIAAPSEGAGFASTQLLARSAPAVTRTPVNLAFASVPGPAAPLYLRGAPPPPAPR